MKRHRSIITLTTDFGARDPFSGIMKGVIAGINGEAVVIDLSHDVERQNIREAAFILSVGVPYFPAGTVHVAVVDPGVGGSRRAVAVKGGGYFFVGPDNGVFSWAVRDIGAVTINEIVNPEYMGPAVSATFHGRDVFAPAAAHLSAGVPIERLGPTVKNPVLIPFPVPEIRSDEIRGEVLYIDRYGNLITNILAHSVNGMRELTIRETRIERLSTSYSNGQPGEVVVLAGSAGFLEIAVNLGSAMRELGALVGDRVRVLR